MSEGTDFAQLGLEIDSTSADKATESLDKLEESGAKVEERFGGVGARLQRTGVTFEEMQKRAKAFTEAQDQSTGSTTKASAETEKFITSIKHQAEVIGLSRAQVLALKAAKMEFTDAQAMEVAQALATIHVYENQGKALDNLGLGSQRARQSLGQLAQDIMRGDFARASQDLGRFIGNSGMSLEMIATRVLPIAGATAVVIGLGKAFNDGEKEVEDMNRALAVTNNYSNLTRQGMRDLADQMQATGTVTMGVAKDIVTQLAGSGRIGPQAFSEVARLASDFASATGKDVSKIAGDLVHVFDSPAKGAEELNKQMHFLTASEEEHLRHLEAIGEKGQAQLELAEKLTAHLPKQREQLGYLESAWLSLRKTASNAWDAMMGIGRPQTLEDQIATAQKNVENMERLVAQGPRRGSLSAARTPDERAAGLAEARATLAALLAEQAAKAAEAKATSEAAATEENNKQGFAIANSLSFTRQLLLINEQIKLIGKVQASDATEQAVKNEAILSLKRKIFDLTEQGAVISSNYAPIIAAVNLEQKLLNIRGEGLRAVKDQTEEMIFQLSLAGKTVEKQQEMKDTRQVEVTRRAKVKQGLAELPEDATEDQIAEVYANADAIAAAQQEANEVIAKARRTSLQNANKAQYDEWVKGQAQIGQSIADSFLTVEEIENRSYENRKAALETFIQSQGDDIQNAQALREQLETEHQAKLGSISAQAALQRKQFAQLTAMQQAQGIAGVLVGLTSSTASSNKAMFELNKAASIANAIMYTFEGANKALAIKGPLGFGLAALVIAAGMANVAKIASTNFGSTSAGGGGSGAGGAPIPVTEIPSPQAAQPAPTSNTLQVIINGNLIGNEDYLYNHLIPAFREAIDKKDVVIIGANSRQAQDLVGAT